MSDKPRERGKVESADELPRPSTRIPSRSTANCSRIKNALQPGETQASAHRRQVTPLCIYLDTLKPKPPAATVPRQQKNTYIFRPVQVPLVPRSLRRALPQLAVAIHRDGVRKVDHAHRHLLLLLFEPRGRRVRRVVREQEGTGIELEDFLPREEVRQRADIAECALDAPPAQPRAVVEEPACSSGGFGVSLFLLFYHTSAACVRPVKYISPRELLYTH